MLSQIGEDAPVTAGQRIGERAALDRLAQTQMIKLACPGVETSLDVAQTFAPSQLRKDQADELLPAGEVLHFVIATIASNATAELLTMNTVEQLRKNVLTRIHGSRLAAKSSARN